MTQAVQFRPGHAAEAAFFRVLCNAASAACPFLLLFVAVASAQQRIPRQDLTPAGAVEGIIQSPEGQALGGVSVVFRHSSTGAETTVASTGEGVVLVPSLPAGTYPVRAALDGFESVTLDKYEIVASGTSVLDLRMRPLASTGSTPGLPSEKYAQEAPGSQYQLMITRRETEPEVVPAAQPMAPDSEVFITVSNRWKLPLPTFRRYDGTGDMQYVKGHLWDPYNTNVLKGDIPINAAHRIFLNLGFASDTFNAEQAVPLPTIPYRNNPQHYGFAQDAMTQTFAISADISGGGDAAYRPVDWRIRVTTDVAVDYVNTGAPGLVYFNPALGDSRFDRHASFQEMFGEIKLKDLSNAYDTVSIRGGIQSFNSDFRGFIFTGQQPGIRVFGNYDSNRYQYNVAVFDDLAKDPNSGLNTFKSRHQRVYVANLYRQDFIVPGYTAEFSFHYNKDDPSSSVNKDGFRVRPEPIGPLVPRSLRAYYYGFAGDGHWGRLNLSNAFYQVVGTDKYNALAGHAVDIDARMAALELSMDHNWYRVRASFFYASGDRDPTGKTASGFDSIFDNPSFAGGAFSYWDRVSLVASGAPVNLTGGSSLLPDLRTSKSNGQANFVNPGLFLYNVGADADLTTRLKLFTNLNFIRFADTEPLELLLAMKNIHAGVGADTGFGVTYRPKNSANISFTTGFNVFFPFAGFEDMFTGRTLFGFFTNVRFRF